MDHEDMNKSLWIISFAALIAATCPAMGADLLVEAEAFDDRGGWKLDTQFIEQMGSPHLLAHGLGRPVRDATTTVTFPATGEYRLWVRTMDWVARWKAPGAPGRFQLLIDDKALDETFGDRGAKWRWQDGGTVEITNKKVKLALHDLTGFDGRCDAIYFSTDADSPPPDDGKILPAWRREALGLAEKPQDKGPYDLVVIGGGYAGTCAAIGATRRGCSVALIQNRPVLGGNGSGEVRVSAGGKTRLGKYPKLGSIVEEITDNTRNARPAEEYLDQKRLRIVRAEKNIDLFLNHHAYAVETEDNRIVAVVALDTRTSRRRRFTAALFADCTGHGTIGHQAGADEDITETGHMGASNMWAWRTFDGPRKFPKTPWALDLQMGDFPYPKGGVGEWFWESGFDRHPINDMEYTRDWNLRAVFGAWNAMKNRGGAEKHRNAALVWVSFIAGPRESRRLLGDVVLDKDDILKNRRYPDGCVPTTWSIDLHYPKKKYAKKYPHDPFISEARYQAQHLRKKPYHVPYRCFYSRNIENLFMAGRDISVTHEALGTVRVMKTCGMMGEVVGMAAAVCKKYDTTPRGVYRRHLEELKRMMSAEPPGPTRSAETGPASK